MQFRVLGPLEAHHEDGAEVDLAARKPAALLAVPLLNANAWVGVHHLIAAIWHEQAALALHHDVRPAAALAASEQVRKIMAEQLGVEPGAELAAARREIAPDPAERPRLLPAVEPGQRVAPSKATGRLSLVGGTTAAPGPAGLDALLASATREVLIMCDTPGTGPIGLLRKVDQENLRRGVRYRVLGPDSARLSGALNAMSLAGAEVRTDVEVPMAAIVIDGTAAVLPADRASTGSRSGVAVFQLPGVVTATVGLFDRIWPSAVPLTPSDLADTDDESGLSQRERELLALLCAGCTDESAGARLGISVRTVRRTVADIMNRLGARSRFQAGVKAADRGWLLDQAG